MLTRCSCTHSMLHLQLLHALLHHGSEPGAQPQPTHNLVHVLLVLHRHLRVLEVAHHALLHLCREL